MTSFQRKIAFLILSLTTAVTAYPALAYYNLFSFLKVSNVATQLSFTSLSQSENTWACVPATVQRENASNALITNGTTTINLSGGTSRFFSDNTCSSSISATTIANGTSSQTVYVYFTGPGVQVITAADAAAKLSSGTQSDTVALDPNTWTGIAGDGKWSNRFNWAGNLVPANSAYFDGNCTNCNATVDAAASPLTITTINLYPTYAGTLAQALGSTITTTFFVQQAGTFTGGNSAITAGFMFLTGGTFTSTSGTLTFSGHGYSSIFSNTFNANGGTVSSAGDNDGISLAGTQFTNLNIYSAATTLNGTAKVSGNLSYNAPGTLYGASTITLNGTAPQTLTDLQGGAGASMNVTTVMNSTSTVTLSGNAQLGGVTVTQGTLSLGTGAVTAREFDQTGGTLNSTSGNLTVYGNLQLTGGTFNANSGTFIYQGFFGYISASAAIFNNVTLPDAYGNTLGTNLTIAGNLVYDYSVTDNLANGGGNIIMTGNGSITDMQNGAGGSVPGIIINTSGTITTPSSGLFLTGLTMTAGTFNQGNANINYSGSLSLNGGTLIASSGTSTIGGNFVGFYASGSPTFNANGGTFIFSTPSSPTFFSSGPAIAFNNLTISGSGGQIYMSAPASVTGNLVFNTTGGSSSYSAITVYGNVTNTSSAIAAMPLVFAGGAAQTFSGSAAYANSITVSKSAGALTLSSDMNLGAEVVSIGAGTFILNGYALNNAGGPVTVSSGATLNCSSGCGAGTACNQGSGKLSCTSLSNSGTITP